MSGGDTRLMAAAACVDVIDAAGRIIGNPRRNSVAASAAEVLALAHATERFWEVCLEAHRLVVVLEMAMPWESTDDEHAERVALQATAVRDLMIAIRGETGTKKETDDGHQE